MADEPNIRPAEGVQDLKVLDLQDNADNPDNTNKSLDQLSKDELQKLLDELSTGPVDADKEARKINVAYFLGKAK
jgi:hypothetical protein